jgi:DNA adenine methylase
MYLDKKEFDTPKERLFRNLYLTKNSFSGDRVRYGYSDNNPDNRRVSKLTYIKNHIKDYQYKLSRTQIHNQDYRSIITQYDSPNTFFYLDPPYSLNRKSWAYNTPLITKEMLLEELKRIQGGFIMSYDYSEDNLKLFGEFFYVLPVDTIYAVLTKARDKKFQEILISNFKIE